MSETYWQYKCPFCYWIIAPGTEVCPRCNKKLRYTIDLNERPLFDDCFYVAENIDEKNQIIKFRRLKE